jgi:hypothetical protein
LLPCGKREPILFVGSFCYCCAELLGHVDVVALGAQQLLRCHQHALLNSLEEITDGEMNSENGGVAMNWQVNRTVDSSTSSGYDYLFRKVQHKNGATRKSDITKVNK